jgi:DNA-binding beta-propeller fold protein YncE
LDFGSRCRLEQETYRMIHRGIALLLLPLLGTGDRTPGAQASEQALRPSPVLQPVKDIPLPGGTGRFDYQSLDPGSGRLYIAQMGVGRLVVFDIRANQLVASIPGFPRATGVLAVPSNGRVYVSVAGRHELAILDAATLAVRTRLGDIRFPDGIAYAAEAGKVFVSDESGQREIVVDAQGDSARNVIPLGGEAGNTQYDSVAKRIWVAVQTRNQLVKIDPVTERITGHYDLPGADRPHGFYIDAPHRRAFVSSEGNARLLVVDLTTMRVTASHAVGDDPDVLAFDPGLSRLYVAAESGVVTVFEERGGGLHRLGEYRAPAAHSVSVDPISHRVYLPLANLGGRPVLRVLEPVK